MAWSPEFRTALISLREVGPATFNKALKILTKTELTEADFWVNRYRIWQKIKLKKETLESIKKFKKEYTISSYFESILAKDIRVVFIEDQEYPPLLKEIDNPPPLLFAKGRSLSGKENCFSVVGTRGITAYGKRAIRQLIPPLVQYDRTIVSGFMYGVDVTAQQAALKAEGRTVGILGFGFDDMYPKSHQRIFEEFLTKGATFYTPFAPHIKAVRGNFPARNAIVAGMSKGTLVIEAGEESGSAITAGYAADFGRDVWAVPGSIFNKQSIGTNQLIKDGVNIATEVADILGVGKSLANKDYRPWEPFQGVQREICRQLAAEPLATDELSERLAKPVAQLSQALIELELLGAIESVGNQWQLLA
jgi:DNA processing protein